MEIKNRKSFNDLIKTLTLEVIEEEEIDEMTATGNIAGYSTPFAFSPDGKSREKKKKRKKNSHRQKIGEALDNKDLEQIKKVVRLLVNDILRDIWLKRTAWNKV